MPRPFHVVVTGHKPDGTAIVVSDAPPRTYAPGGVLPTFYEVWHTTSVPAPIHRIDRDKETKLDHAPPKGGTRIRLMDFEPETKETLALSSREIAEHFAEIGSAGKETAPVKSRHPFMHRTETIDYGIMIEGELTLIMDEGERVLKPGDVCVQLGTNHSWANRGKTTARICFVLQDGVYDADLAKQLGPGGH